VNRPAAARFGAAAVTGALLAASRPPLDLGPLACVAFVPLFVAWRGQRARTTAAYAFVAAAVIFLASFWVCVSVRISIISSRVPKPPGNITSAFARYENQNFRMKK